MPHHKIFHVFFCKIKQGYIDRCLLRNEDVGVSWCSFFSLPQAFQTSWRRKWQPTPVRLLGKSHGWGSLVGHGVLESMGLQRVRKFRESSLSLQSWFLTLFHFMTSSYISAQFSSVTQSCPTLCDPMNHSMPGLPVYHKLPEFTQTHVHRVGDAIQPSHPLSSPSSPAPNPSPHQGLFQGVSSSHEMAKVLEFQLQYQSFQ